MTSNFVCGIQARSGSTRLPGKALLPILNKPMWKWSYDAVRDLCPTYMLVPAGDPIIGQLGFTPYMTGSESEPLDRYLKLAEAVNSEYIIRITSDCPLVASIIILDMMCVVSKGNLGYLQNTADGCDIQIIHRRLLLDDRYQHPEHVIDTELLKVWGHYREYRMDLSVDTIEDFVHVNNLLYGVNYV